MKCKYIKDDKQCQAPVMHNAEYCYFHNPEIKRKRKHAQKKGGKVSYYDKGLIKAEPIDITADKRAVIYILADTINRVRRVRPDGSLDVKTANSIGQLAGKMIEAQKEVGLTERLDALEARLIKEGVLK